MSSAAASAPKVCTTCGARYPADALFCPADGTPLTSAAAAQAQRGSDPGGDPYLGREISGHIEIRQLAGVGAMGRVYRAFQKGIDRDVAVKVLHRELSANAQLVTRFHREAKVASRLQHPNVVQVHLAGQLPDGAMYIVMEYLDGLSLQSALAAAGGAMPLPRALHVALQLCDAAGEAHAQGVVHRDLKPENVMLVHRGDDSDTVKVLDFGIARLNWGEQSMATAAGLIFGTARYISPEGAQGEQVGPQGDVYSIAVLIYQMLAGRTPFEGEQAVALLVQQIHDPPPYLKSIPRAAYVPEPIAAAVMKNLVKDPNARDRDGHTFGRALLDAAKASGLSPEDLVSRSVLLGARGPLHLPPMQRTKQLQLERPLAELLAAMPVTGGAANAPATVTAFEEPHASSTPPAVRTSIATSAPVAPRVELSPAPRGAPSAATQKWTPPAAFEAQLAAAAAAANALPRAPAPSAPQGTGTARVQPVVLAGHRAPIPSGVDETLNDATAPPPVVLPEPSRASPDPSRMRATEPPERPRAPMPSRPMAPSKPPSNVDTTLSDEDASGLPRRGRWRWVGIVLVCFLLGIGITTMAAYKMNLLGSSGSNGSLDDHVSRAGDALRHKRWDAPAGDNVKDLTTEGLARWPNEPRLVEIRERATGELVNEAMGRKFAGDLPEALHLARLASELDPNDTTAQHLVADFEAQADAGLPVIDVPLLDAGRVGATGRPPVAQGGPFHSTLDVSPAKPRVGQAVDLVVKVTTAAGAAPKKLDEPMFQISGGGMGAGATLPAVPDGGGVFRASFTFLAPGKYEITFVAKGDGLPIKASRALVTSDPSGPPPNTGPSENPPPAPSASVKWL